MKAVLGLKENWKQFSMLVIINAFVGGMVGLERTILPKIAEADFHVAARTAILSFIIVFGISKALTNYVTGRLADRFGRRKFLILGWIIGLPVPLILIYAPGWNWIIFANILLGINQGLTWSSTVVMKIDLVGEKNRGLAMGINESSGYLAVGIVAFLTGWLASEHGLRPYPFYLGIGFAVFGLLGSIFLVKDTSHHVNIESGKTDRTEMKNIFWLTTWKDRNLGSITQGGFVNNLNDGMMWGVFPMLLAMKGFNLADIGRIVAVYPMVWGLAQLVTGKISDHVNHRLLLFSGMLLQGLTLATMAFVSAFESFVMLSVALGIGTAMVYPTFLSSLSKFTHPRQRADSIGTYRLWRDLGYSVGAFLTGIMVDALNVDWSVLLIAFITIISSIIILVRMD